ncbi:Helix-turn-helix domain protein [Micromonospora sp. MW-13]|nr:Helix-turn-helix domain protein [Micromonospora sp. MW-13]
MVGGGGLSRNLTPRWYSPAEVAVLLGFGLSKVKMKIATGELRSIKDGKYRRILPEWVDDYIHEQVERQEAA